MIHQTSLFLCKILNSYSHHTPKLLTHLNPFTHTHPTHPCPHTHAHTPIKLTPRTSLHTPIFIWSVFANVNDTYSPHAPFPHTHTHTHIEKNKSSTMLKITFLHTYTPIKYLRCICQCFWEKYTTNNTFKLVTKKQGPMLMSSFRLQHALTEGIYLGG